MFSQLIGNSQVKTYLERMIRSGAVKGSLLFCGPSGVGKSLFAKELAKQLLGEDHSPDLFLYRPKGKLAVHSIADMKNLCEEIYLAPYHSEKKVFIIEDADRMLTYSAHALLKTFEEPAAHSIIFLITHRPEQLLGTVRSRCRSIRFHSLTNQEIAHYLIECKGHSKERAQQVVAHAQGSLATALEIFNHEEDKVRSQLLERLFQGEFQDYKALCHFAKEIADQVEVSASEEPLCQEEIYAGEIGELSAVEREKVTKELEGLISLRTSERAWHIFTTILGWYRDLHLLQCTTNLDHLIHKDFYKQLSACCERGNILPLSSVSQAVSSSMLAFERSTPLATCLEGLFLKLNLRIEFRTK